MFTHLDSRGAKWRMSKFFMTSQQSRWGGSEDNEKKNGNLWNFDIHRQLGSVSTDFYLKLLVFLAADGPLTNKSLSCALETLLNVCLAWDIKSYVRSFFISAQIAWWCIKGQCSCVVGEREEVFVGSGRMGILIIELEFIIGHRMKTRAPNHY